MIIWVMWGMSLVSGVSAHARDLGEVISERPLEIHAPGLLSYEIRFLARPSRPKARGRGPCGAGEEVTLQVFLKPSKKPVWTRLVESCLESLELEGGRLGNENAESLTRAVRATTTGLKWTWLRSEQKFDVELSLATGHPALKEALRGVGSGK